MRPNENKLISYSCELRTIRWYILFKKINQTHIIQFADCHVTKPYLKADPLSTESHMIIYDLLWAHF